MGVQFVILADYYKIQNVCAQHNKLMMVIALVVKVFL